MLTRGFVGVFVAAAGVCCAVVVSKPGKRIIKQYMLRCKMHEIFKLSHANGHKKGSLDVCEASVVLEMIGDNSNGTNQQVLSPTYISASRFGPPPASEVILVDFGGTRLTVYFMSVHIDAVDEDRRVVLSCKDKEYWVPDIYKTGNAKDLVEYAAICVGDLICKIADDAGLPTVEINKERVELVLTHSQPWEKRSLETRREATGALISGRPGQNVFQVLGEACARSLSEFAVSNVLLEAMYSLPRGHTVPQDTTLCKIESIHRQALADLWLLIIPFFRKHVLSFVKNTIHIMEKDAGFQ